MAQIVTHALHNLHRALQAHGVDADAFLHDRGFTLEGARPLGTGSSARMSHDRLLSLKADAARALGDPNLGLMLAAKCHLDDYDRLRHLVEAAPTPRHALHEFVRAFRLWESGSRLQLITLKSGARLMYDHGPRRVDPWALRIDGHHTLGLLSRVARHGHGPAYTGLTLGFAHPQPEDATPFRDVWPDATLVFDTPTWQLELPDHCLDQPSPGADAALFEWFRKALDQILQQSAGHVGLAAQVTQVLESHLPEMPTLAEVARTLGMSERTLQRRLHAEQQPFSELVGLVREGAARAALLAGASVESASAQAGYAAVTSLQRAFRSRTGETPGRFGRRVKTHGSGA